MSPSVPDASNERIVIGRVGAAHGIRGELRIIPLTDFPERFAALREVMVGDELLHLELRAAEAFLHLLEHLRAQLLRQLCLDGDGHLD